MIPPFNEHGYLPPGIHPATMDEIDERFGRESEVRRAEMESLTWLVDLAVRAGALRIVVNGSFVTDVYEPNDVDWALLIAPEYPADEGADAELQQGLPFLQIELLTDDVFGYFVNQLFATDRQDVAKGMIEVML